LNQWGRWTASAVQRFNDLTTQQVSMEDTIRAFVAIRLPEHLPTALRAVQEQVQSGLPQDLVRWCPPEQIHLTLKFLGNIASASVGEVETALQTVCWNFAPLLLRAEGLGCFPNPNRPRVIWVGLGGDLPQLHALQSQLDSAMKSWVERNEERAFHPHLTIGRVREISPRAARQVGARIKSIHLSTLGEWKVSQLSLMQSKLHPEGAEHSLLATVSLRGT
jgi:2'-5' RNA ligase